MPRVTVKAKAGRKSVKLVSALQKAFACCADKVLVVYEGETANVYYEGEKSPRKTAVRNISA